MMAAVDHRRALRRALLWSALVGLGVVAIWLGSLVPNADWYGTYDAAGRAVLAGRSPYEQPLFVNPPWTVLLLLPFMAFPPGIARGLVLVCSLASWTLIAWKLSAPRLALIVLVLSPTAIGSLLAANLDAFVMLGLLAPPTWGLLLLMIKPQFGVGPAAFHLVESWRNHRLAGVARTMAPVVIASVVSALLFPVWVDRMVHKPANVWNRSLFPYSIPLGVFLLWLSLKTRNAFFALAATPFFAPYLTFPSYLAVQIGLLHQDVERYIRRDLLQAILSGLLWIIMLVFRL